jgi:hypothetical protein
LTLCSYPIYFVCFFFTFFPLILGRLRGHILQDDPGQNRPHPLYLSWFGMYALLPFLGAFLLTGENTHFSFFLGFRDIFFKFILFGCVLTILAGKLRRLAKI